MTAQLTLLHYSMSTLYYLCPPCSDCTHFGTWPFYLNYTPEVKFCYCILQDCDADRQTDRQLNPRQNAQNCFYGSCCYSRCLKEHNMPSWHTHTHTTRTLTNFSPNPSFNITPVHTLPLNLTRTSDIMISCIRSPLGQLVLTWSVFVSEKVPNK